MSTLSEIRSAWEDLVFSHPDILAITAKALNYEVMQESEKELTDAYFDTDINFFEYVVSRPQLNYNVIGGGALMNEEQIFNVEIRYTKYAGTNGQSFNDVGDALETLIEVVKTSLGSTWNGLVDFVQSPITITEPSMQKFNDTDCVRAVARFTAIKQVLS